METSTPAKQALEQRYNINASRSQKLVEKMLRAYEFMGAKMSLKMHFLHSHIDFFHPIWAMSAMNMGKLQSRYAMENRYQRKLNPIMMGDYRWFPER